MNDLREAKLAETQATRNYHAIHEFARLVGKPAANFRAPRSIRFDHQYQWYCLGSGKAGHCRLGSDGRWVEAPGGASPVILEYRAIRRADPKDDPVGVALAGIRAARQGVGVEEPGYVRAGVHGAVRDLLREVKAGAVADAWERAEDALGCARRGGPVGELGAPADDLDDDLDGGDNDE